MKKVTGRAIQKTPLLARDQCVLELSRQSNPKGVLPPGGCYVIKLDNPKPDAAGACWRKYERAKLFFCYTRSRLTVGVLSLMTVLAARGQVCYTITDLGTLGGSFSIGTNINARGQVVGIARITGDSNEHAFLYSAGHMQDLGTLGGNSSYASSINDWGQVVGASTISGDTTAQHAFLYSAFHMKDIGTLGGSLSYAEGMNNRGQVVGRSSLVTGSRDLYPFLYGGGHMVNLNSLLPRNSGWILDDAISINDAGEIVGGGTHNGLSRAFRMTPVR